MVAVLISDAKDHTLHPLIKMHNALRAHRFRVHYVFSEEI